eukprot:SAG31_NODE_168_length_21484_cov_21.524994_8_plen_99_part_00
MIVKGDVEFQGAELNLTGKLSVRSDQWHETFSISTLQQLPSRARTVLQHVEPDNPQNVIGFGSGLSVLSNNIWNGSTAAGKGCYFLVVLCNYSRNTEL